MTLSMTVTTGYEQAYSDAKDALYRRGKRVGKVTETEDGPRLCFVDGVLLSDREVLVDAWGDCLADEIISERAAASPLPACLECRRLWAEYTAATRRYLRLFTDQSLARNNGASSLAPLLEQTLNSRRALRSSILRHAVEHAPAA